MTPKRSGRASAANELHQQGRAARKGSLRTVVLRRPGQPLQMVEWPVPVPDSTQVLVQTAVRVLPLSQAN